MEGEGPTSSSREDMLPGSQVSALGLSPWLGLVSVFSAISPIYSSLAVAIPCLCREILQSCPGRLSLGPKGAPLWPCPWHHSLTLKETPSFGLGKKRGGSALWAWPLF